jgi:two-component system cell cycle response regulator DivK
VKKILVVEDVELNRDLVVQLLEDDFAVVTAVDGAQGIEAAERERPDLILLDLSLPVVDGWEVARRIKANRRLRDVPVIALSAHAMPGDAERALRSGCDDYLSKPLDEHALLETVNTWLEKRADR